MCWAVDLAVAAASNDFKFRVGWYGVSLDMMYNDGTSYHAYFNNALYVGSVDDSCVSDCGRCDGCDDSDCNGVELVVEASVTTALHFKDVGKKGFFLVKIVRRCANQEHNSNNISNSNQ